MISTTGMAVVAAGGALLVSAALMGRQARARAARERQVRRLEETQSFLQAHIAKLDTLVAMLAGQYHLGMSGAGPANREELCDAIVKNACRLLNARRAYLALLEPDGQTLRVAASQGLPAESAAAAIRLGEGVTGRVAETGRAFCVEDMRADQRFLHEPRTALEARAMASVALHLKDRVLGALTVLAEDGAAFDEREARLLGTLADQAALSLENFELYDSLRRFNIDLAETLLEALNAKEAQDRRAAGRGRELARELARELDLPDLVVRHVEYAALMRGVGKIGVGDAILRKTGKLTPEEYALIKKHPEIGSRILAPVAFLAPVAPMVRYHQEWYNGQGYPEGLSGEEIPMGSRIVAVVGAWEAMTSDRPYRRALTREAALAELRKGAGTQFDPKVVEAFLRVLAREAAPA